MSGGCLLGAGKPISNAVLHAHLNGFVAPAAQAGFTMLYMQQQVDSFLAWPLLLYCIPRHFRLFRAPDGHQLLRIAAGSAGSVRLVIGQSASAALGAPRATLAGVYRGFAGTPEQPRSADWRTTCGDTHPGCADGGCDAGLTRCLRCAAPQFVMGSNGRVSALL